jgi:required for meiotic nuclear division protein 1
VEGKLVLPSAETPCLQIVADILAESIYLDNYEQRAAGALDRIEPLAERMHSTGYLPKQAHNLIRHIGEIIQIQHHMVARAPVWEKPDVL